MVVIDEAGQMNIPETLGVCLGKQKYVVVGGDEKQIGVHVENKYKKRKVTKNLS